MVFYDTRFIFDGIDSVKKNIALVDTEEKNVLMNYGTTYLETISSNTTFSGVHLFKKDNEIPQKITLEFCLVRNLEENDLTPLPWNRETEQDFMNWIVKDDFCKFISYDNKDLIYFLKAVKINRKFNSKKQGVYIIEFQPFYNLPVKEYIYTGTNMDDFKSISIDIPNNKPIYPIILLDTSQDSEKIEVIINDNSISSESYWRGVTFYIDTQFFIIAFKSYEDIIIDFFNSFTVNGWPHFNNGTNTFKISGVDSYEIKFYVEVQI